MVNDKFMRRAIALAALADGQTHPNPMVGAVVVRNGRIVGEGFHRQAGMPHAEVEALRQAGRRARGAELYVTLEPCCHHGKTPPCTEAIIAAGIRQLYYGMRDPNPQVHGRGLKQLRAAGIRVHGPVCEAECRALNPAFIHWATTGMPYVIVKVGATLDGKIADAHGRSQWITNAAAREYAHTWRARVDGIVIGRKTLAADDPQLTVRLPGFDGAQPRPIVLTGRGAIPRERTLVRAGMLRPAIWVVPPRRVKECSWLAQQGHDVWSCPLRNGRYDLRNLLRRLGQQGMSALLVEGGGTTIGGFLRDGNVDYIVAAIAPMVLGGTARGWTDDLTIPSLSKARRIDVAAVHRFGDNVVIEGPICRV